MCKIKIIKLSYHWIELSYSRFNECRKKSYEMENKIIGKMCQKNGKMLSFSVS